MHESSIRQEYGLTVPAKSPGAGPPLGLTQSLRHARSAIPHFDKGGPGGIFKSPRSIILHQASSFPPSCPTSVIGHPSSPPTSHQQSICIRPARHWSSGIHLLLSVIPRFLAGISQVVILDPFDFAQDKGHRRISPSHDIVHPGQILRPGLNPPPSCMPATSRNRSQFLVILQAKSDDEIITNML
jgi:hypothetical protein